MSSSITVLGVMSGTSLDGIDLALVHFYQKERKWRFELKAATTVAYSSTWQEQLKNALSSAPAELTQLNRAYTELLSDVILNFLAAHPKEPLSFVSSHGHTVHHRPEEGYTFQLGNLPILAQQIGHKVICDFRVADVALGGQGAPLVPGGEVHLFSNYTACMNLGGFANLTLLDSSSTVAFDICAVNTVLNPLVSPLGIAFDEGGKLARDGAPIPQLLQQLNALDFYQKAPPKSLGIEWVLGEIVPLLEHFENEKVEDKLHTYSIHIAQQIAKLLPKQGRVLITGGGAYHRFLIEKIKAECFCEIEVGSPSLIDFKEAIVFAFLGVLRNLNEVNCLASVTGATQNHSSGNIFFP